MKICHLCLNGPYNEGWNYQENILPKYHVKQGHTVYQIVTPFMWEKTDLIVSEDKEYINGSGVHIIRCKVQKGFIGGGRFNRYPEAKGLLESINPDCLFIHGVQFMDLSIVASFLKKHPMCVAYADNHGDFSNSAKNWISRKILHGIIWKSRVRKIIPYVRLFYGVLPARVDFLVDVYGIPKEKVKLLVMGADDEKVVEAQNNLLVKDIRGKYGIRKEDFLIVTGGKIDMYKTQTLQLMEAVGKIDGNVKLIVFGSVSPELKEKVDSLSDGEKVQYIGWIDAGDTYDYFATSDLVIFPGRHSVFWEQVAGQGIPLMVKDWAGTHHVDMGGNVVFLRNDTVEEIKSSIDEILRNPQKYLEMKKVAKEGAKKFSYNEIARQSIT